MVALWNVLLFSQKSWTKDIQVALTNISLGKLFYLEKWESYETNCLLLTRLIISLELWHVICWMLKIGSACCLSSVFSSVCLFMCVNHVGSSVRGWLCEGFKVIICFYQKSYVVRVPLCPFHFPQMTCKWFCPENATLVFNLSVDWVWLSEVGFLLSHCRVITSSANYLVLLF